jgi:hypothetical protein
LGLSATTPIAGRFPVRDFNIGVQAGTQPNSFEIALAPETVRAASEVNARIVLTVYASGFAKNVPAA